MGKLPWMKFYPMDWLTDTAKQMLSYEGKGFWIDLSCYLWMSETRGKIIGTYDEIGNMMGIDGDRVERLVLLLKSTNTANVTIRNKKITIISRRMVREEKQRISGARRQSDFRERHKDKNVTDSNKEKSEVRSQKSEKNTATVPAEAIKLTNMFLDMRMVDKELTVKETDTWFREIWKLHRIDKESWEVIESVIRWVLNDEFWRTNCHSPLKFRRSKDSTRYWDLFKALSLKGGKHGKQVVGDTEYGKNEL